MPRITPATPTRTTIKYQKAGRVNKANGSNFLSDPLGHSQDSMTWRRFSMSGHGSSSMRLSIFSFYLNRFFISLLISPSMRLISSSSAHFDHLYIVLIILGISRF